MSVYKEVALPITNFTELLVLISHLVWVLLGVLLVLALLGVSHTNQTINIGNLAADPALVSITGTITTSL